MTITTPSFATLKHNRLTLQLLQTLFNKHWTNQYVFSLLNNHITCIICVFRLFISIICCHFILNVVLWCLVFAPSRLCCEAGFLWKQDHPIVRIVFPSIRFFLDLKAKELGRKCHNDITLKIVTHTQLGICFDHIFEFKTKIP